MSTASTPPSGTRPSNRDVLRQSIADIQTQEARIANVQTADPATRAQLQQLRAAMQQRRRLLEQDLAIREDYYASSTRYPVSDLEKRDPYKALAMAPPAGQAEIKKRIALRQKWADLTKRNPKLYSDRKVGDTYDYAGYACVQNCMKPAIRQIQKANMGSQLAAGMKDMNTSNCKGASRFNYPHNMGDPKDRLYRMPTSSWQPVSADGYKPGQSTAMDFRTKPGVKPSAAINQLFEGNDCPILVECQTAVHLLYYRAVLKTIGPDAFDRMFPNGISLSVNGDESNRFVDWKRPCRSSREDLKPGDWVYFYNDPNYIYRHPSTDRNSAFQGENALVTGKDRYGGFGVSERSEKQMNEELLNAYNTVPEKCIDPENDVWVPDKETAARWPKVNKVPGLVAPPVHSGHKTSCPGQIGPVGSPNVDALP